MRKPDLIHAGMLDRLGDTFYNSLCTIRDYTETQSTSGAPSKAWAAVTGLEDIPCRVAIKKSAGRGEVKRPDGTFVMAPYEATLQGWFAAITEAMRARIDGTDYDILLSQPDSEAKTTHLDLQIVR